MLMEKRKVVYLPASVWFRVSESKDVFSIVFFTFIIIYFLFIWCYMYSLAWKKGDGRVDIFLIK